MWPHWPHTLTQPGTGLFRAPGTFPFSFREHKSLTICDVRATRSSFGWLQRNFESPQGSIISTATKHLGVKHPHFKTFNSSKTLYVSSASILAWPGLTLTNLLPQARSEAPTRSFSATLWPQVHRPLPDQWKYTTPEAHWSKCMSFSPVSSVIV